MRRLNLLSEKNGQSQKQNIEKCGRLIFNKLCGARGEIHDLQRFELQNYLEAILFFFVLFFRHTCN